ncbi:MAG: hypothetical protein LBU79_03835 [Planctomycetota bacterium]|nr:hypothetical protein [Planctomycetota bacterium]
MLGVIFGSYHLNTGDYLQLSGGAFNATGTISNQESPYQDRISVQVNRSFRFKSTVDTIYAECHKLDQRPDESALTYTDQRSYDALFQLRLRCLTNCLTRQLTAGRGW